MGKGETDGGKECGCRRQDLRRQGVAACLPHAQARQPPWHRHRCDRHRQDRDAAGAGRGLLARRRSGVRCRHQERPVRHCRPRPGPGFRRQARERHRDGLPARRISRDLLGSFRRARPPGARDDLRNGPPVARPHHEPERDSGRGAQHRVQDRRRTGDAAARSQGSAGDAHFHRRERRFAHQGVRQRIVGLRRHDSAPTSCARQPARGKVLRRTGARYQGPDAHGSQRHAA